MTVRRPEKGIEGFDNYTINDCGTVRGRNDQILKVEEHRRSGHLRVTLWKANKKSWHYVHALVAQAFIGPRPPGLEVCHRDGNVRNNSAANLYYGTRAQNAQDRERHKRERTKPSDACEPDGIVYTPDVDLGF